MKRIISALLVAAMIAAAAGCAERSGEDIVTPESGAADKTEETEDTSYKDDLPDNLDYDGETLYFLSSLNYFGKNDTDHRTLVISEEEGDVLNSAIYRRDMNVSSRFNISMKEDEYPYYICLDNYKELAYAGDDVYDVVSLEDQDILAISALGMVIPMGDVMYVDMDKPYWNKTLNDSASIGNHQYVAYADYNLSTYDYTHILLFNKDMLTDYSLEDPYDIVERGSWTFDAFEKMAYEVASDVDGNGRMDEDDIYGWLAVPKQISPLVWIAGGALSVVKDDEDIPHFAMNDERMLSLLLKAYNMTWNSTYWYHNSVNDYDVTDPPIFSSQRALFTSTACACLFGTFYRSLQFDYGIIPYPKYNEEQTKYYTRVEGGTPQFVPATTPTPDFSGAMLEALACESANIVIPAYYEISLKIKYTRDDRSVQMLEMIMNNRVYDLGDTLFNHGIRDGFVIKVFSSKMAIVSSEIEENRYKVEKDMESVVDSLKALWEKQ